jgi:hypothetical protein
MLEEYPDRNLAEDPSTSAIRFFGIPRSGIPIPARVHTLTVSRPRYFLDFLFPILLAFYAIWITFAAARRIVPPAAPQPTTFSAPRK